MSDEKPTFNDLYRQYFPRIHRYISRRAGEAEADDLTQAVFLKISQGLGDFRGESSLATWIYRIAANVITDGARMASSRDIPRGQISDTDEEGVTSWNEEVPVGTDEKLIRREMNQCIRRIVDKLPEQSRTVIRLSEFEGLKNTEIAEALGTSLANVKIRLHRARVQLKENMNSQCRVYRDERNELVCDPKHCP